MCIYHKLFFGAMVGWSIATIEFSYKLNKESDRMRLEREKRQLE